MSLGPTVLSRVKAALASINYVEEGILWGSQARRLATGKPTDDSRDVDLVISYTLCKQFYGLAAALRHQGLHPVWTIPDDRLDKALEEAGLSQEPICQENQHGTAWTIGPLPDKPLNLDLIFNARGLTLIPNSENWTADEARVPEHNHTWYANSLDFYDGCEDLFASGIMSSIGLLYPSREAQITLYLKMLERTTNYGLCQAKIRKSLQELTWPIPSLG